MIAEGVVQDVETVMLSCRYRVADVEGKLAMLSSSCRKGRRAVRVSGPWYELPFPSRSDFVKEKNRMNKKVESNKKERYKK